MGKTVKRLIDQFVPENYKLSIEIDEEKMVFSGNLIVAGKKVGRPSKRLTFHQKGLSITSAKVTNHAKQTKDLAIKRINTHKSFNEVRLHSTEMVYPGQYEIKLEFSGKITDQMTGLYPSYFEKDGQKKIIFGTQFESHHAREVFPCIDEPAAKATFELTLTTKLDVEVLANTEVKTQTKKSKKLITEFEKSPIMSSYLLAFVVGDIHSVQAKSKNGVMVRSWASTAQTKKSLEYANAEAVKILDFFEEYFDTPFPLKKLDQVALPDFESGAMENWGLITYREIALLTDPDNSSIPSEQYVSMVIAHELSHQWFGNLVTMKWWDDLWLNESFASLVEHLALDDLHPDWHQWETYASQDIISCSNRDIYSDVQAVGVGVNHPDEIGTLFDPAIVYAKGGRLLKMMREFIGDEAFRAGLKNYFKKFAYQNTVRGDLWQAMSDASGHDINALMTPWLEQSGIPMLLVQKINPISYRLYQGRFLLDGKDKNTIWPIPLLSDQLDLKILSVKNVVIITKSVPLINIYGSGHYITNYTNENDVSEVLSHIKSGDKYAESRINFLNDLTLGSKIKDDGLSLVLNVVLELKNEKRDAVWAIMARALGLSQNLGEDNKIIEEGLKKIRRSLAADNYQKLGWDDNKNDDPNTVMLRATMIGLLLGAEDEQIINKSLEVYKKSQNIEDIVSDRRGAVFGSVVRHGNNSKDINDLIAKYKSTSDPDLQNSIASGLTYTKDKVFAKDLIDQALGTNGFVRAQDVFRWHASFMRNKHTRELAWNWMTQSWDKLEKQFGGGKSMDYFVTLSAGPMQTKHWQDKFNKFFDPMLDNPSLTRNIKIAKSEINARIDWRNRELKHLQNFFKNT